MKIRRDEINEQVKIYQNISLPKEVRDEAFNSIWDMTKNYYKSLLNKQYNTFYQIYPEDLLSVCLTTLLENIMDFNTESGYAFITFMQRHIDHAICEFTRMLQGYTGYYAQQIRKLSKKIKELDEKNIRWNEHILAEETKLSLTTVKECLAQMELTNPLSLQVNSYFEENAKEEQAPTNVEKEAIDNYMKEAIHKSFEKLTKDERIVVELTFGFNNKKEITLTKIAEKLGIDVSKVKKIKISALSKLKNIYLKSGMYECANAAKDRDYTEISFIPEDNGISILVNCSELDEINF